MARKITQSKSQKRLEEIKEKVNLIKVRLDQRTVITISSIDKLEKWKSLFPDAQLI
jgi:tetrahydromethanopterin S-methyltransferase subunit G